jgi:hypothetical protein
MSGKRSNYLDRNALLHESCAEAVAQTVNAEFRPRTVALELPQDVAPSVGEDVLVITAGEPAQGFDNCGH